MSFPGTDAAAATQIQRVGIAMNLLESRCLVIKDAARAYGWLAESVCKIVVPCDELSFSGRTVLSLPKRTKCTIGNTETPDNVKPY
jgi:hypothetical protein